MMPMRRQPAPAAWADKERNYLAKRDKLSATAALHDWQHERLKLAKWFHAAVRPRGEPDLCSYCDGQLGETSPKTIDHFLPEESFPELGLTWDNLYPACYSCNTLHKRTQWSCSLLRPDADLVSPDKDPSFVAVFKNEGTRCDARRTRWQDLRNAVKHPSDDLRLEEMALRGPYRFVAIYFLAFIEAQKARTP